MRVSQNVRTISPPGLAPMCRSGAPIITPRERLLRRPSTAGSSATERRTQPFGVGDLSHLGIWNGSYASVDCVPVHQLGSGMGGGGG